MYNYYKRKYLDFCIYQFFFALFFNKEILEEDIHLYVCCNRCDAGGSITSSIPYLLTYKEYLADSAKEYVVNYIDEKPKPDWFEMIRSMMQMTNTFIMSY